MNWPDYTYPWEPQPMYVTFTTYGLFDTRTFEECLRFRLGVLV